MGHESLQLVEHVVIDCLAPFVLDEVLLFSIISTEHIVPEARNHEELLEHTVHVADAAEVPETDVWLVSFCQVWWGKSPLCWLFDRGNHWSELLEKELLKCCI